MDPLAADSLARVIDSLRASLSEPRSLSSGDTLAVTLVRGIPVVWPFLGEVLKAILTVFVGVVVFVVTQALAKLAIEPSMQLRRVIHRVSYALVFHANVHSNPGTGPRELLDTTHRVYRALASELRATDGSIPSWSRSAMTKLRIVPPSASIQEAATELILLSNSLHETRDSLEFRNSVLADTIRNRLRLP